MAGSIRSVIAENGLEVADVTSKQQLCFPRSVYPALPQLFRCRGKNRDGLFISTYGQSQREAVNKWLGWNS